MKKISILGSTGSIGITTLKIIDKEPAKFKIILLSSNNNFKVICKQIKKYNPKYFLIRDKDTLEKVKKKFKKKKINLINSLNFKNLNIKSDITISAIPGIAGLEPTLNILNKTKKILIANKEAVICGWDLIKNKAKKNKTKIIPVDSEHFSIFKLLENHNMSEIEKVYLTASGGPFLKNNLHLKKKILPNDALKHPKWKMGKKISVDSSTLMNKILEYIEAQRLFSIENKKLDILIHPESLVHAIIKLRNGLIKFIYHETSMTIPLANAIFDNNFKIDKFYKNKNKKNIEIKNLTFTKPDPRVFPVVNLKNRVNEYPSTSIIINACNEILVDHFLSKKIAFLAIPKIIRTILNDKNYKKYAIRKPQNLKQISDIDMWARITTRKIIKIFL